jgi:hypothetical protein
MLTVVDDVSQASLAVVVVNPLSGTRVARELVGQACGERDPAGLPGSVGGHIYHYRPRRRGRADSEKRTKDIYEMRVRCGYRSIRSLGAKVSRCAPTRCPVASRNVGPVLAANR